MRYAFADCELDTDLFVLHRHGRTIRLRPKVFQVLSYLLEHHDEVVSKDALIDAVWPNQYISEATLADTIRTIRQAVGDKPRHAHVIQTRHGHGYHFVAEVTVVDAPASDASSQVSLPQHVPAAHANVLPVSSTSLAMERKVVTMVCGSLGNSVLLLDLLGLDALHSLMHSRYDLVKRLVEQYGGTLQPLQGDRVLAVFGAPMTHEDHAWRAALAAFAMRDGLQELSQTEDRRYYQALAVRLGLYTGQIVAEAVGETPEQSAVMIGDVIALATALQEHAAPDTILCSETTMRLVGELVDLEPRAPILLHDLSHPVMAYTLLAPRVLSPSRHWLHPLSPFVGRERELATLEGLVARAQSGQGHVVVIVGEPGIGKSRLLYEFRRQVDMSVTYVASECLSYGAASPYLPVLQLLRQMCAITEADSPKTIALKVSERLQQAQMPLDPWAPPLLDLLGGSAQPSDLSTLSPQAQKGRLFSALLEFCIHLSQQRPLVLEVENAHWIDATSEEWLRALKAHLTGYPLLLLMSCRPEYQPDWIDDLDITILPLSGLSLEQSRQVLQAVPLAGQIPEPLTRELLAKADGNPFFLEELTRAMVEHPSDAMPVIPDHLQAVLAARIDRLPASAKHLLQVAAIIGKNVPLPLLEGVVAQQSPVLQQSLQHLRTAGFLYEALLSPVLVYTFKHALIQDVAYQSLLLSGRQSYHYQIARLISERFPGMVSSQPEQVAHHYTESGHFEEALPYWQSAGDQAVARSANLEAIRHFTKGLEVLTHLPVTTERNQYELRLQLALSAPLLMTRGASAVGQVSQRILELCQGLDDKTPYMSGLVSMWRFLFNMGQIQKAREMAEQCFAIVRHTTEPGILLEMYTMLGSTYFILGDLRTALVHFQHGASLETTHPPMQMASQPVDTGVVCLGRQAQMLWHLGYADRALTTIDRAMRRAQTTRHAFSLVFARFHQGLIHYYRGEIDALHEDAEAVVALARAHEFAYYLTAGQCLQGVVLAAKGAPEAGLVKLQEALMTWQARGPMGLSALYTRLASLYHQCGQIEAGLRALDKASTFIHTREERHYEPEVYRLRGELLLDPSIWHPEQAESCFQQACDTAAHQHAKAWELRATMSLCRLRHHQGPHQAAHRQLERAYNWFTEGFTTQDLLEAQALLEVLRSS